MNRFSSRLNKTIIISITSIIVILSSCGGKSYVSDKDSDILVSAGSKTLSKQDVLQKIPVGIEPSDSAALFHLIVENWIKSEVLSNLAETKLPDMSTIENKVREYRNRLIVAEYLKEMKDSKKFSVSEDSIRLFYERYKVEMLTESPLVKGIYLKVSSNLSEIEQIKELMSCGSDECIDRLEKLIMNEAVQYDYFKEDWIDWQMLADQIPHRFSDPDIFLKSNRNFATTYEGSTYLLHVSDYLPTGSIPPYEFAAIHISELLERTDMRKFEDNLVKSLVGKALKDGSLVAVGYDPLSRTLTAEPMEPMTNAVADSITSIIADNNSEQN